MLIGVARIVMDFYGNDDATKKRRLLAKLCEDLRKKFNASAMEVADLDDPERCVVGIAAVIPEAWMEREAHEFMKRVCAEIDRTSFARVTVEDIDLLSHGEI